MTNIVLASSSESRKSLLSQILIKFIAVDPDCDETPQDGETPFEIAKRLGQQKAESLSHTFNQHLIIGSDQVATFDDKIAIGKPMTQEAAYLQLKQSSGRILKFYTSICLLNSNTGHKHIAVEATSVTFRSLTDIQIHAYLKKEDVRFCAGSFKAESLGPALFTNINGTDPSSLIGLPLIRLTDFLSQEGVDPLLL